MNPTQTLSYLPLAKSLLPASSWLTEVLLVLGGSLFIGLLAQPELKLSFSPVPLTLQTLAVLLVGAVLGSRLGFWTGVAYLLEGFVLPVFAGGATWANPRILFTAGFLISFPLAAGLVGFLVERYAADRSVVKTFGAMLLANVLIYLIGLPWLAQALAGIGKYSGISGLLAAGLTPFLAGDLLKVIIVALLLPTAWRLARR